jgi:hypothetical protein
MGARAGVGFGGQRDGGSECLRIGLGFTVWGRAGSRDDLGDGTEAVLEAVDLDIDLLEHGQ